MSPTIDLAAYRSAVQAEITKQEEERAREALLERIAMATRQLPTPVLESILTITQPRRTS